MPSSGGLSTLLDMAVAGFGEHTAFGTQHDGLTYTKLDARAQHLAASLGDAKTVAFLGVNSAALPVALFAASAAGIPFAPLNYRLSTSQLITQLGRLDSPVLVADHRFAGLIEMAGLRIIRSADIIGSAAKISEDLGAATIRTAGDNVPDAINCDEQPAVLLFTSGTTAEPKLVVLKHENLLAYVFQTAEFGSGADQAAIVCVPPYHIAGIGAVLSNLYNARRVVYLADFSPTEWLDLVATEAITNAMLVPTMLSRIVEQLGDTRPRVPSLRAIAYGGAKTSRRVIERALELFPDVDFTNAYGLTETSSSVAVLTPLDHRTAAASLDPVIRERLSSAGHPLPGMELKIVDEDGDAVPVGITGSLWLRGSQVSGQYSTHSTIDAEGWFPTRDRAFCDAAGYLYITGRDDDTIIRGGENIAPAEIEDVIAGYPGVRDVAVFGVADEQWGERIVATIVVAPKVSVDHGALADYVRQRLRSSRTPDDIVTVHALPYSPTGKLVRSELRDLLSTEAAAGDR